MSAAAEHAIHILRVAFDAFQHNHAIDWDLLPTAADALEKSLAQTSTAAELTKRLHALGAGSDESAILEILEDAIRSLEKLERLPPITHQPITNRYSPETIAWATKTVATAEARAAGQDYNAEFFEAETTAAQEILRENARPEGTLLGFDLVAHVERQRKFSEATFGPGPRVAGVIDHIRRELTEVEANPTDLFEWTDIILLAIDGAWRAGYSSEHVAHALGFKQTKNEARTWPDWRTAEPGKAIEHDRSADK